MGKFIIVAIIFLALDLYVFKGISLLLKNTSNTTGIAIKAVYWLINLVIYYQAYKFITGYQHERLVNPEIFRFWSGVIIVVFFTKIGFALFHLFGDLVWLGQNIKYMLENKSSSSASNTISRSTFLTQLGLGAAALLFGTFTYGVAKGRYAFQVINEKISFDNLPEAFNGLKIVQISDLHLGSFVNDFGEVQIGFDLINEQEADYIFFTGDLVNGHSSEAEPWIEMMANLKAKKGKYSIFGNHDYADYGSFSDEVRIKSVNRLKEIHKEMGFKLLEDEHLMLEENDEKIVLAGMHNWGNGFHRIGDINKTLQGVSDDDFIILLSHDPSLWEEEVKNKRKVDLTLSGHTHGMQMGVEIPLLNIKWSPAKFKYEHWAGLYQEAKNYIYINRGFGFLGFPGRVGIKPEITVLELFSKKA